MEWRRWTARLLGSGRGESRRGGELGHWNVDGEVCSLPLAAPRKEKGNTGRDRNLRGVREDKGADAEVGRDCRRVERRRRAQAPVWPASAQCRAVDTLFLRLKDFSPILTS